MKNKSKTGKMGKSKGKCAAAKLVMPPYQSMLEELYSKRTGGKVALQGFLFQAKYSYMKILEVFGSSPLTAASITLEGFEDLDYLPEGEPCKLGEVSDAGSEYTQVKFTSESIDASAFWGKKIIQNFADLYVLNKNARFVLATNLPFKKGELKTLEEISNGTHELNSTHLAHWQSKIETHVKIRKQITANDEWDNFDALRFLRAIRYEFVSEEDVDKTIVSLLIKAGINTGNESLFVSALSWDVICWSRERKNILVKDFSEAFELIKRNIGKGVVNPAVQNRWIEEVDFQISKTLNNEHTRNAFFSGKAAKPVHIASGYPVERGTWKSQILALLNNNSVVVIRASSGQGKSTLVWQSALELKNKGYSILELAWCERAENVGSIVELLDSFLKSGRRPVVIIDGLNAKLNAWGELVKRCTQMPVSFLVTTREEDWKRYPAPESEIQIQAIEISLEEAEAKGVFERFKEMGRVHHSVHSWQSAWEQVQGRALLLEYTYLLSFGAMIEERIKSQMHELEKEIDGPAKLEVLRLVSFADLCEVKLDSSRLLKYVMTEIKLQRDKGSLLESLNMEYHVLIEDGYVVEGLHTVRSMHIANILHGTGVTKSDTALNLIGIIDSEYYRAMATSCLTFIPGKKQRDRFLKRFSEMVTKASFDEKNSMLEGFLAFDAGEYAKQNEVAFDELHKLKTLPVALPDICPWSDTSILGDLLSMSGINDVTNRVRTLMAEVKRVVLTDLNVYTFLNYLGEPDLDISSQTMMKGLGNFISWRNIFGLPAEKMFKLDYETFCAILLILGREEGPHLGMALSTSNPQKYMQLIGRNMAEFVSLVKDQADVFTIKEEGNELQIKYPARSEANKRINDQSVERIYKVASFLPDKEVYEIHGIYAPAPQVDQLLLENNESHKRFSGTSAKVIFHPLANSIWYQECLKKYQFMTYYEWQDRIFNLRKVALGFVESLLSYTYLYLEGARLKQSLIQKVFTAKQEVKCFLDISYDAPRRSKNDFYYGAIEAQIKQVNEWERVLENVNNQFSHLFEVQRSEHMFRVAHFNIRNLAVLLPNMQEAFHLISSLTKHAFQTSELEAKETHSYRLLAAAIIFLYKKDGKYGMVRDARKSIKEFHSKKFQRIIRMFGNKLSAYNLLFHLPSKAYDDGTLTSLVIGVERDSDTLDNQLLKITCALIEVIPGSDVTYINVFFTKNGTICLQNGLRYSRDFLEEFAEIISGERSETKKLSLPIEPNDELLKTNPAIKRGKFDEKTREVCNLFLESAWHLSEAHQRLNRESPHEVRIYNRVKNDYENLKLNMPYQDIVKEVDELLQGGGIITKEQFEILYQAFVRKFSGEPESASI